MVLTTYPELKTFVQKSINLCTKVIRVLYISTPYVLYKNPCIFVQKSAHLCTKVFKITEAGEFDIAGKRKNSPAYDHNIHRRVLLFYQPGKGYFKPMVN